MATRVRLRHPQTGIIKDGFYGFSWTSFFFGGFPALFRGDVGVGLALLAGGVVAGIVSAGLLWFAIGLVWAFVYNKRYAIGLLERGYVLDDEPHLVSQAKASLGVS
jgi:hypothetical protein